MKDTATYHAKLKDGKVVEINHDGFHYRATGAAGQPVGQPFIGLTALLKDLDAELMGAEGGGVPEPEGKQNAEVEGVEGSASPALRASKPADVTECGQHEEGMCNIDDTHCDGDCGEHAIRVYKSTESRKMDGADIPVQPAPAEEKKKVLKIEPLAKQEKKRK